MAYSDVVLADAPVMYLPMQETAGTTLADTSGNAHDATLEGTVALADATDPAAPAGLGGHVRLDGSTGAVRLAGGSWFDPSAGLALEGWFYVRSVTTWDVFFDLTNAANSSDVYLAGSQSGGSIEFVSHSGGVNLVTPSGYPVGEWFHVGVSMTATGDATIYLNGAALATGNVGAAAAGVRDVKRIGLDAWGDPPMAASVTQAAIYNAPLSAARFTARYNARTGPAAPAPPVETSTEFANYGYNYAGTSSVDYEPPIAPAPAGVRRSKVMRVHQSIPAPTLVDGRPV